MGFFKDFKDDFSEAVNDLVPDAEELEPTEEATVNTLDEEIDVASELSKLDGLLEQVTSMVWCKLVAYSGVILNRFHGKSKLTT